MSTTPDVEANADAEHRLLTTGEGRALLVEVAGVKTPLPSDLVRWRKLAPPEIVSAALRLTESRRRGAAKFARAEAMWFDPVGLEQATSEIVARHKAERFRGASVVDLCCGIGGDAIAIARDALAVVAVDSDQGMCRRARWNARVYEVADRLVAAQGLAESFVLPAEALVHIDPDRRARSTRSRKARALRDYQPDLAFLRSLIRTTPGGAIKLGPASDFGDHFADAGVEIELVSLNGECKEATAWFGTLAGCRRRATRLPEGATWTDRDAPSSSPSIRRTPGSIGPWVFDPDPSLVRSGLIDGFAGSLGLARVAGDVDLFTGPEPLETPWLSAFEVEEVVPMDLKRLRRITADRGLGPLEIKTKGLDLRPEILRAQLRPNPKGGRPATLLLIGGSGPARAIIARKRAPGE